MAFCTHERINIVHQTKVEMMITNTFFINGQRFLKENIFRGLMLPWRSFGYET